MGLTRSIDQGRSMSSSLRSFGQSMPLIALAVLFSMAAYPAQAQTAQECDANAAFDRLMSVKSTSALGEFTIFLKEQKFAAQFKEMSAGKAILAPHNSDMMNRIFGKSRLGLAGKKKGYKSTEWKLTQDKRAEIVDFLETLVVDVSAFRTSVKPDHPCDLVAVTRDSTLGLKGVMKDVSSVPELFAANSINANPCADIHRPGRGLGRKPGKMPNGRPFRNDKCVTKAFGKNGIRGLKQTLNCAASPPAQGFIPVGDGYNSLTGYPATTSSSATDSALFQLPVFNFTGLGSTGNGVWCYTEDSHCYTLVTVSASASAQQTQSSMDASLSMSAEYEENSFSANTEFSTSSQSASASTAFSCVAGSQYKKGAYKLDPGASDAQFSSGFINALANIATAVKGGNQNTINQKINTLYNSFGTHVITDMTIGGEAQATIQMSASANANLASQSISAQAHATATYGLAKGSVDASYASSQSNAVFNAGKGGSISTSQSPAQVDPPFLPNSENLDCAKWTSTIDNAALNTGGYAYIGYKILALDELITDYFGSSGSTLFNSLGWDQTTADNVALAIKNYMTSCGYGTLGCKALTSNCQPGYYGSNENCNSCYGNSASGTYNTGNCPYGTPCDGSSGACLYTGGLYGHLWRLFFGTSSGADGCANGIAPFNIAPAVSGTDTNYCQGYSCNGDTGGGGELGTSSSSSGLWNYNFGNQDGGTWSLTGYFVPQVSGSYKFKLYGDDCAFMWLDANSNTGALGGSHTASNAYIKSGLSYVYGNSISLTAFNAYPVRIQFGNKRGGATPWGIHLQVSSDGINYYNVGGGAGNGIGGYLYHNHNTEVCDANGNLHPEPGNANEFYNCGAPNQGTTNSCLSQYSQNCAIVGY